MNTAPRFPVVLLSLVVLGVTLPACGGGGGGNNNAGAMAAPVLTGYSQDPASYTRGQAIAPNLPTVTGNATTWSVAPALPAGLVLDPGNGQITGNPTVATASASYTITAANPSGADTYDLVLEVLEPAVGTTEMASRNAAGDPGNSGSNVPTLSRDGRWTVFDSFASNLSTDDTNFTQDVFRRDNLNGAVEVVSLTSGGTSVSSSSRSPSVDADGSHIAFVGTSDDFSAIDTNGANDIYLRDPAVETTVLVSLTDDELVANDDSEDPSIAPDGLSVAFRSSATNLVTGDTNGDDDIFVRDLQTNATVRVSVATDGSQANGPSFSPARASGIDRTVFTSVATNLVAGDTNGERDVFLREVNGPSATTTRLSVSTTGTQANGSSFQPAVSPSGRHVVFQSFASNLVTGDTNGVEDVFWHDVLSGQTLRVSVASDGSQANGASRFASVSDDGRYITFDSLATNLVANDTNGVRDVFRHDRVTGETIRLSESATGDEASEQSFLTGLSGNGRTAVFISRADELDGSTGNQNQVFVRALPITRLAGREGASSEGDARGDGLAPLVLDGPAGREQPLVARAVVPVTEHAVVTVAPADDALWLDASVATSATQRLDARTVLVLEVDLKLLDAGRHTTTVRLEGAGGQVLAELPVEVTCH